MIGGKTGNINQSIWFVVIYIAASFENKTKKLNI